MSRDSRSKSASKRFRTRVRFCDYLPSSLAGTAPPGIASRRTRPISTPPQSKAATRRSEEDGEGKSSSGGLRNLGEVALTVRAGVSLEASAAASRSAVNDDEVLDEASFVAHLEPVFSANVLFSKLSKAA